MTWFYLLFIIGGFNDLRLIRIILQQPLPQPGLQNTQPSHLSHTHFLLFKLTVGFSGFCLHNSVKPRVNVGYNAASKKALASCLEGNGTNVVLGKKNRISRSALAGESLPCAAFWVVFVPYRARKLVGCWARAVAVSVGPSRARQLRTASGFVRIMATTGLLHGVIQLGFGRWKVE